MTLQIVILNQKRTFAISDAKVTVDECKSYDGAQKIFNISNRLSTILLLSGNTDFDGQNLRNLIDEFVSKQDFNNISSVEEIKSSLNDSIAKSTRNMSLDEYVENTFGEFEKNIKKSIGHYDTKDQKMEFLKYNAFHKDIDFLAHNGLLNSKVIKLTNSLFNINTKDEFDEIKFLLVRNYLNFIIKDSPNIVLVGYDEFHENPTYIDYALLLNNGGKIETIEKYSLHNCNSTMVIGIAQDGVVDLILTGFNDDSFRQIQEIVFELFEEFGNFNQNNPSIMHSINNKLEIMVNEIKLHNLKDIIDYIKILPDSEIFELLDALIAITSIKMKFSSEIHSVGGKRHKVVLRKYEDVKFVE